MSDRIKESNKGVKRYVLGAVFLVIGLLIAIGPQTIFAVCERDPDTKAMACYYTSRVALGAGLVIAALGVIYAVVRNREFGLGISTAQILLGILVFLIPTVLIGVCKGEHMHCHSATLPALVILSILLIIVSAADIILYFINKKNKRN